MNYSVFYNCPTAAVPFPIPPQPSLSPSPRHPALALAVFWPRNAKMGGGEGNNDSLLVIFVITSTKCITVVHGISIKSCIYSCLALAPFGGGEEQGLSFGHIAPDQEEILVGRVGVHHQIYKPWILVPAVACSPLGGSSISSLWAKGQNLCSSSFRSPRASSLLSPSWVPHHTMRLAGLRRGS